MGACRAVVLADDLTGAGEIALESHRRGLQTSLDLSPGPHERRAAVCETVVGLHDGGPAEIEDAAMELAALDPMAVLAKIDSRLRRRPRDLLDGVMRAWPGRIAIVAPAFPAQGRLTVDGRLLDRSRPSREPGPRLSEVFGGSEIDLADVRRGPLSIRRQLERAREAGERVIVGSAESDGDLDAIVASVPLEQALWVGSLGLAYAVLRRLCPGPPLALHPPRRSGPLLIVAGSRDEVTLAQLETLQARMPDVSVLAVAGGAEHEAEAARLAAARLRAGRSVVLVDDRRATGGEDGEPIARLGRVGAAALLSAGECRSVLLTGGSVARAVCRELDVRALEVLGGVAPLIPMAVAQGGLADGLQLITKGGSVGDPEMLVNCLQEAA